MGFVESGPADDAEEVVDSRAKMEDACLWVVERNRLLAVKADAVESAVTATAMGNRLPIMFFNDKVKLRQHSLVPRVSTYVVIGQGGVVSWRSAQARPESRREFHAAANVGVEKNRRRVELFPRLSKI